MTNPIDLTGQTLDRWTVQSYAGKSRWHCRCKCGTEALVDGASLRHGRSAGCSSCMRRGSNRTHGAKKTRLYNIWCGMKRRCLNPKEPAYPRYGGRGIGIVAAWRDSFEAFRAWALQTGYADHLTIDRVNNDGNYEPGNCRWATYAQQTRNYRRNRPIQYQGRTVLICDLALEVDLPQDVLKNRINRYGWPIEKAVSTPVKHKIKREPWKALGISSSTFYRRYRSVSDWKRP